MFGEVVNEQALVLVGFEGVNFCGVSNSRLIRYPIGELSILFVDVCVNLVLFFSCETPEKRNHFLIHVDKSYSSTERNKKYAFILVQVTLFGFQ